MRRAWNGPAQCGVALLLLHPAIVRCRSAFSPTVGLKADLHRDQAAHHALKKVILD
jgi:hypothetical protein